MKRISKLILGSAVLVAASLMTVSFVSRMKAHAETSEWKYGLNGALGFNENTYATNKTVGYIFPLFHKVKEGIHRNFCQ